MMYEVPSARSVACLLIAKQIQSQSSNQVMRVIMDCGSDSTIIHSRVLPPKKVQHPLCYGNRFGGFSRKDSDGDGDGANKGDVAFVNSNDCTMRKDR
jgi:hypothetical protein